MFDNYGLWEQHDAEQEAELYKLPKCSCCGEPVQDEYCYEIQDEIFCEDCLNGLFRKETENFYE